MSDLAFELSWPYVQYDDFKCSVIQKAITFTVKSKVLEWKVLLGFLDANYFSGFKKEWRKLNYAVQMSM